MINWIMNKIWLLVKIAFLSVIFLGIAINWLVMRLLCRRRKKVNYGRT